MKFSICIGGLTYNITCLTGQFYEEHGKPYECPYSEDACSLSVTEDTLKAYPYYDSRLSICANETVYLLDSVIRHCLDHNRMIIHGAAIACHGSGYLFAAPSGTGKTTHIGLWEKYLDGVEIINGDKPMLNFDKGITVCGTPWNGKENLGGNLSAPLKAIVVLKQGKKNLFQRLDAEASVIALLQQSFYPVDKVCGPKTVAYIGKIVNSIPIFSLECDISKEAFEVCYNGLRAFAAEGTAEPATGKDGGESRTDAKNSDR